LKQKLNEVKQIKKPRIENLPIFAADFFFLLTNQNQNV